MGLLSIAQIWIFLSCCNSRQSRQRQRSAAVIGAPGSTTLLTHARLDSYKRNNVSCVCKLSQHKPSLVTTNRIRKCSLLTFHIQQSLTTCKCTVKQCLRCIKSRTGTGKTTVKTSRLTTITMHCPSLVPIQSLCQRTQRNIITNKQKHRSNHGYLLSCGTTALKISRLTTKLMCHRSHVKEFQ